MKSLPFRFLSFLIVVLGTAGPAWAEPCASMGPGNRLPALTNEKLSAQTRLLCNSAFVVLYSGVARDPIWSAEHLTASVIRQAQATPRRGEFQPDERLPANARAELSDYVHSGYDRGHMSPSGDMPDDATQEESFRLSNVVPQTAALNRGRWEEIESAVRRLTLRDGEVYVVTGPAFHTRRLSTIGSDRVLVPTSTWKAVYDPRQQVAGVYVCRNAVRTPACHRVTIATLIETVGVDPFPALPPALKQTYITLPIRTVWHGSSRRSSRRHAHRRRTRHYRHI
ncbi:DNA/RNA non-specific endonuclease [Novacetimonas cocois]|uniref:Endonuclease n=1 Tax=Novacetimonas cocois TaxID=1747507 RepID=A0A365YZV3_9PROT|nr:DNA/RNA non-specific endonuclease [Novacetimonas cocois]RBM07992.1 DNA/RNA non-specific endonuclease [Novacetimonas cocois]